MKIFFASNFFASKLFLLLKIYVALKIFVVSKINVAFFFPKIFSPQKFLLLQELLSLQKFLLLQEFLSLFCHFKSFIYKFLLFKNFFAVSTILVTSMIFCSKVFLVTDSFNSLNSAINNPNVIILFYYTFASAISRMILK